MKKDAVIMAGGDFGDKDRVRFEQGISQWRNPLFVAADRGVSYLLEMGISPDYWIGDFDSTEDAEQEQLLETVDNKGGEIIRLNPVKDDTDTEAALSLALEKSDGDIYIFGGLGGRIDHSISNIHILKKAADCGRRAVMISSKERISLVTDSLTIKKDEQYGNYVSVFPFSGEAKGVSLTGFKYPMKNGTLHYGTSLGQSNEIVDGEAVITVRQGILLVIESVG